jgi:hypothetical protein
MSAEDAEREGAPSDTNEEIDALIHELELLRQLRANLDAASRSQVIVEALTGLTEERQAELDRARRTHT